MTPQTFEKVLGFRQGQERKLLLSKGREYAPGFDRLSNFKAAAGLQSCTPEKALMGMLAKHLVSIADMINAIEPAKEVAPVQDADALKIWDRWDEKIGDARAYLALLDGLVRERLGVEPIAP